MVASSHLSVDVQMGTSGQLSGAAPKEGRRVDFTDLWFFFPSEMVQDCCSGYLNDRSDTSGNVSPAEATVHVGIAISGLGTLGAKHLLAPELSFPMCSILGHHQSNLAGP